MAKNTDDIATQLAVLKYVKIFDIDGAVAEAEIQERIKTEQEKAAEKVQSADSGVQSETSTVTPQVGQSSGSGVQSEVTAEVPVKYELKKDSSGNTYVDVDESLVKDTDTPIRLRQ